MSFPRFLILTIGPFAVIAAAYWATAPQSAASDSHPQSAVPIFPSKPQQRPSTRQGMADRCRQSAERLRPNLPPEFGIVIRPPFLIAGDLPQARLQKVHSEVLGPVSRALQTTYFRTPPREPITIVVCSTEELFRKLAKAWDGHLEAGYHGYYQRDKRRILLDLEAGNGSLAHELTHALSHADCEDLPEWFDEGLGALHEEATYTANGQQLIGLPNWRCRLTRQAAFADALPKLTRLTDPTTFRTGNVGLNYAMARSLCLFLQDRHLLKPYYEELRRHAHSDPQGLATLCRVLGVKDSRQLERQFTAWVKTN